MAEKQREILKRGYELGNDDPAPDKLPPVRDPGPGAGAQPKPAEADVDFSAPAPDMKS